MVFFYVSFDRSTMFLIVAQKAVAFDFGLSRNNQNHKRAPNGPLIQLYYHLSIQFHHILSLLCKNSYYYDYFVISRQLTQF